MLLRCVIYFIIEDAYFYFVHRWLHTEWAYNKIHYLHHKFNKPVAYCSSYAHPAEMVLLGIGSFIGTFVIGGGHLFGFWVWMTVRQVEALDVHSGYDFPFSRWIPFYCGAHHHDFHHRTYDGNYASTFTWMDRLFGTDKAYQIYCQREAKQKRLEKQRSQ
jgi:4,4-dimethyl-9beta,19-cyclopropylsterol-4alpha-methyl oxidase